MTVETKFGMLRKILRAIGLSQQAADDAVNFIVDLLAGEHKNGSKTGAPEFPYHLRQSFLSTAELNFYNSLKSAVSHQATICAKVGLNDLFYVKKDDPSRYRIYTNKIDRKHVDFLLCDSNTMKPLVGIELDDKSHERKDRQERDLFVDEVFRAARLPIIHIPVHRQYNSNEIATKLAQYLQTPPEIHALAQSTPITERLKHNPKCPKCGGEMILRTARKGDNAGQQFWGCSNYPTCRGMLPYNP